MEDTEVRCGGILFDLDGVLVDSRRCVEYVWERWAAITGRDAGPILAVAHGRRTPETLREVAPDLDVPAEVARLDRIEEVETRGLAPVLTARELLASLPPDRWAIVTSGSPAVARLRLGAADVPWPTVLVTAADVVAGKPAPDGFLLAANRLGVPASDCVVVEDTPPGIAAAKAAGMRAIAVLGTVEPSALAHADLVVSSLAHLRVVSSNGGEIRLCASGVGECRSAD